MSIVFVFVLLILILYYAMIQSFMCGWKRIPYFENNIPENNFVPHFISVVVAMRNEENNIENILCDLLKQNFDKKYFEIIICDDHSEDSSVKIVEKIASQNEFAIYLVKLTSDRKGKKQAIELGIKKSKGEIICLTDADCRVPRNWLSDISAYFQQHNPALLIGAVKLTGSGAHHFFQQLEFLSLISSGAGATGINRAILCNGANLSFRKELLPENKKIYNSNFASGDDIMLLEYLKKIAPSKIHFLKARTAIVETASVSSVYKFVNQRKRWASKSFLYTDFDIIAAGIVVALQNFMLLFCLIGSFFSLLFLICFFALFFLKSMLDYTFLKQTAPFFDIKFNFFNLIAVHAIYLIYIPLIAILSQISAFEWKERKMRK